MCPWSDLHVTGSWAEAVWLHGKYIIIFFNWFQILSLRQSLRHCTYINSFHKYITELLCAFLPRPWVQDLHLMHINPLLYPTAWGQAEPWCWNTIPGICPYTLICWCQKECFLEITVPCRYSLTEHTAQKSPNREEVYILTTSSSLTESGVVSNISKLRQISQEKQNQCLHEEMHW